MKAIVCVNRNWQIGLDGQLIYQIPEDMKRFKEMTIGKTIIMGKNTLMSIGGPLPERKNIIITSDRLNIPEEMKKKATYYSSFQGVRGREESVIIGMTQNNYDEDKYPTILISTSHFRTLTSAVDLVSHFDEVIVCGGASIYEQLLPYCDECFVTMVEDDMQGDSAFPNLDKLSEWELSEVTDIYQSESKSKIKQGKVSYSFRTYKRIEGLQRWK